MNELVVSQILNYLVENDSLKNFGKNWYYSNRSVILWIKEVFFLVQWNYF